MAYNCSHCYDCGYIMVVGKASVVSLTAWAEQYSTKGCTYCPKGELFDGWKQQLLRNPCMSNDYNAWYQKNAHEGYIV